jgi:autotransporter-associated beta strand protein
VKSAALSRLSVAILFACLTLLPAFEAADAGSATWQSNPLTNDWNNAGNWTPMTIPNGPADTASFGTSHIVGLSLSANVEVDGITFEPGANTYTIATGESSTLTLSGAGIVNNSDKLQNFSVETGAGSGGVVVFSNNATAGSNTTFNNEGGPFVSGVIVFADSAAAGSGSFTNLGSMVVFQIGGYIQFGDTSTAENAVLVNEGGTLDNATGGQIGFAGNATAANATITNGAGPANTTGNTSGGTTALADNSTAANAMIVNKGSNVNGGTGGVTFIGGGNGLADAGNATLIAEGGSNGGAGGQIVFMPSSSGGTSRIELFGNGTLDIRSQSELTIGSLEGDGIVLLPSALTIGRNNLSTTFSGVLEGSGDEIIKTGKGTLTLAGANTYSGGTIINSGTLVVSNNTDSGTGTGSVQVNAGTLSGSGIIGGTVTVGTGSGRGATLAPAVGQTQENLTIQSALIFQSDATYRYSFKANGTRTKADRVTAKGVTINSGAAFSLRGQANGILSPGLVITVISNTAATPISGTFSNLPDGGIVNVNGNNLRASYTGGDGNDLTLTVQ